MLDVSMMEKIRRKRNVDFTLLTITAVLILIGLLILSSVSSFLAEKNFANTYSFLIHQLIVGIAPGIAIGIFILKKHLHKLKRWSTLLLLFNIFLMCLVFLPKIGLEWGGAHRWLKLGSITFQPSEFLKITLPFYLAAWFDSSREKHYPKIKRRPANIRRTAGETKLNLFSQRLIPFLIILGVISTILIIQKDLGTLSVIAGIALLMYFVAGTSLLSNLIILLAAAAAFIGFIVFSPYRFSRLLVYLNPDFDPMGKGYQIKQALIAVGSGGLWGSGFGLSQQKLGFLPQPLNDAIFAIFAEEAGFIGGILLLALFLAFLWRGLRISMRSADNFLKYLALGLTCQIVLQAFVNISALIGLLPLTGIPLPFVSYGGSHIAAEIIAVSMLLDISRHTKEMLTAEK